MDNSLVVPLEHHLNLEMVEVKLRSLKIRRWLKLCEVALYLGVTYETLKKRHQRGKFLNPKMINGFKYWDREEIDQTFENSSSERNLRQSFIKIEIPKRKRSQRWRSKK